MNPNDIVKVKLTESGKRALVLDTDKSNQDLAENWPRCYTRFSVPRWDDDGWYTAQFWVIIQRLGSHFQMGSEMPFTELQKVEL